MHPSLARLIRLSPAIVALLCGACEESHDHDDGHHPEGSVGPPTGATCPPGSTLTYESFAQPFMEAYCTRCHSSQLSGAARNGAPLGHDFDTEAGILVVGDHVDQYAGAGPNAVNTTMPPEDPRPTEAERRQLAEWLACETAGVDGGGHTEADGGPEADSGP
jgi:hypothetical protein